MPLRLATTPYHYATTPFHYATTPYHTTTPYHYALPLRLITTPLRLTTTPYHYALPLRLTTTADHYALQHHYALPLRHYALPLRLTTTPYHYAFPPYHYATEAGEGETGKPLGRCCSQRRGNPLRGGPRLIESADSHWRAVSRPAGSIAFHHRMSEMSAEYGLIVFFFLFSLLTTTLNTAGIIDQKTKGFFRESDLYIKKNKVRGVN